jgi:integrase
MTIFLKFPAGYESAYEPEAEDVIQLVRCRQWSALEQVPICVDHHGITRASFGQNRWDCSVFSADKGGDRSQREFNFTYLEKSPELLLEAKLIVYGWLFEQGHCFGQKCKLSTLTSRFNSGLKKVLENLVHYDNISITDLNNRNVWLRLENDIAEQSLSKRTISIIFTALQSVERLNAWLPFQIALPDINFLELAKKLADQEKIEYKQALAIPQELANVLYGEAVRLVESAWPHRDSFARLERDLQSNYDTGRAIVDYRVMTGKWKWLHGPDGKLDVKKYTEEINKATPQPQTRIITQHLKHTGFLPDSSADGNWLVKFRTQLQTACFICCGAFTGMRVSEIFELHIDSFHTYRVDNQVFHAVSAATHKLAAGKKNEEWLASPVVEKAIALAIALSACAREQLLKLAIHSSDPGQADRLKETSANLWLSQSKRKNLPILISRTKWNDKLKVYSARVGAIVDSEALAECRLLNPRHGGSIEEKVRAGKPWPLLTHQFRRTFACFAVRNNLGHPISIKQQFKHLNLRMSEWYGNGAIEARLQSVQVDSELVNLLNEVKLEQTTTHFDTWFNGDETLTGSFGKAIVAMRTDKPVIYSSWDNLYRLVREKRLTLHGTLHSYCKNGYDCDMEGVINPAFCVDCRSSGSVIDAEKARWWQQRHLALTDYLQQQLNVSPAEYAHCITQIRAAESVMSDHSIVYTTYEHPIKVLEL